VFYLAATPGATVLTGRDNESGLSLFKNNPFKDIGVLQCAVPGGDFQYLDHATLQCPLLLKYGHFLINWNFDRNYGLLTSTTRRRGDTVCAQDHLVSSREPEFWYWSQRERGETMKRMIVGVSCWRWSRLFVGWAGRGRQRPRWPAKHQTHEMPTFQVIPPGPKSSLTTGSGDLSAAVTVDAQITRGHHAPTAK